MTEPLHGYYPAGYGTCREAAAGPQYTNGGTPALVVNVDARHLVDLRETLGAHHTSERALVGTGCEWPAGPAMRLLAMLFYVCAHPELGAAQADEEGCATGGDASQLIFNGQPKVDIYFEAVFSGDDHPVLRAVRVHFIRLAPEEVFCFNRALDALITQNAVRLEKRTQLKARGMKVPPLPTEGWPFYVQEFSTRMALIEDVLRFLDPAAPVEEGASAQPFGTGVCLYQLLRPQRAHEMLVGAFPPVQGRALHWSFYLRERCVDTADAADEGAAVIYGFPRGAQRVHPTMVHPEVLFRLRLFETDVSREWALGLTPLAQELEIKNAIRAARARFVNATSDAEQEPAVLEDLLDELRAASLRDIEEETRKTRAAGGDELAVAQAVRKLRQGAAFFERFQQTLTPNADVSPTTKVIWGYAQTKMRERQLKNESWCPYWPQTTVIDGTMDYFANMISRFLIGLERTMHVSALHPEALVCLVAARGALHNDYDLKFHVCMSGLAASGKSFLQDLVRKLSIAGTVQNVSHQTKLADTVDKNENGLVLLHDEMPAAFFIPGGNDELEKEKLSRGMVESRGIRIVDGQRIEVKTLSKLQTMWLVATNRATHTMPEALRNRFFFINVPNYPERENKTLLDHIANEKRQFATPRLRQQRQLFVDQTHFMHLAVAVVETMVYIGLLEEPNMDVFFIQMGLYRTQLEKQGITIQLRDLKRMLNFASTLTIKYAVYMVFFTPHVFGPDPRPFDYRDFLQCQPFLFCTTQITAFTLTALASMFVDPRLQLVISAVADSLCNYRFALNKNKVMAPPAPPPEDAPPPPPGSGIKFKVLDDAKGAEKLVDFNYLEPPVTGDFQRTPMQVVAEAFGHCFRGRLKISDEGIEDMLTRVLHTRMRVQPYETFNVQKKDVHVEMECIVITTFPRKVFLLRHFVEACVFGSMQKDNAVVRAIRASWHSATPEQRLIIGEAIRPLEGDCPFTPHLLRVIRALPDKKTTATIANPEYDEKQLRGKLSEDEAPVVGPLADERRLRLDADVEDVWFLPWIERLGLEEDDPLRAIALPSNLRELPIRRRSYEAGSYPNNYLAEAKAALLASTRTEGGDMACLKSIVDIQRTKLRRPAAIESDRLRLIAGISEDDLVATTDYYDEISDNIKRQRVKEE